MKPSWEISKGDDPDSSTQECSIGLLLVVSVLFIFSGAAALRLSVNSHFTQYFASDLLIPRIVYRAGRERDCRSIESLLRPPEHLMHNMTEEELLWRASVVATREGYPFLRVPKVAFLFLTRGPLPFLPLWERFFRGGEEGLYSVYVHAVPGYQLNVTKESAFYGRHIPSKEVQWGSTSLVDAEKRLLANALLDLSNERFVLLSESCIPVVNFTAVYNYLTNSSLSFVQSYDEDSKDARGRYVPEMAPDVNVTNWRKGSEWFELSRRLAASVVADTMYYDIFREYCSRPPCFPDEHYIPTYLNMFHAPRIARRSVTWVDWSRGGVHPATYGAESVTPELVQSIRNGNGSVCTHNSKPASVCFLFARKFAPNALGPLLNLSSTVMGF